MIVAQVTSNYSNKSDVIPIKVFIIFVCYGIFIKPKAKICVNVSF